MFKNHFKIAIRSFLKDRINSVINLGSLAVGLACVFMIMGYISYELSYDKSYSNSDRIYRVVAHSTNASGVTQENLTMPDALAYTLKTEFPDIESVSKLTWVNDEFLINDQFQKVKAIGVDTSFFHLFNFPFLQGSEKAFRNSRDMVLTASIAKKLFPGQNAVGQTLATGENTVYKIVGVIKDLPGNTHFKAEAMVARIDKQEALTWRAYSTDGTKYILLKPGVDPAAFSKKVASIYKKYEFPEKTTLVFEPVTSIHLYSKVSEEGLGNNNMRNIYIFAIIAVLILLIGCINYINLTTARSLQRLKEVGVRKVLGASKGRLIGQFITESILFFIISLPFAFLIAGLLWRPFAGLISIEAGASSLLNIKFIGASILIGVLTGILSGLYPSLLVSRLNPLHILKGWQQKFNIRLDIRKPLIVFQFTISVVLIIATLVVYSQLHLLNNMELGFNKENLLILPWQQYSSKAAAFKNELAQNKDIKNVSIASWEVGEYYGSTSSSTSSKDTTKEWEFSFVDADFDFIRTTQAGLLRGRNFSPNYPADMVNVDSLIFSPNSKVKPDEFTRIMTSRPIIVTQKTIDEMGLKEPFLGQTVNTGGLQGTIIGIVKDFNGISLLKKQSMLVMRAQPVHSVGFAYIRIGSQNISQTLSHIESTWKQFFPQKAFDFSFVDEKVQKLYSSQQKMAGIFNSFAVLAILIAIIGLFSLLAISVRQKSKEISIRKVLGASVSQIVQLLSSGFIKLVLIAIIIASPLAWWLMNKWLQDFQYRTTIHWWIFAGAGLFAILMALSVTILQAIKAAVANPAVNLRTE